MEQSAPPPFSQKDFGDLFRHLENCQVKGSETEDFVQLKGRFANFMMYYFSQEQKKQQQAMELIEKLKEKNATKDSTTKQKPDDGVKNN